MTKTEETKFLDECAMRAMQTTLNKTWDALVDEAISYTDIATWSYAMAEAMLKEKLKREEVNE